LNYAIAYDLDPPVPSHIVSAKIIL